MAQKKRGGASQRGARRNQRHCQAARSERLVSLFAWLTRLARFSGLTALVVVLAIGAVSLYRYVDRPMAVVSVVSPFQRVAKKDVEALVGDIASGGFISLDLAVVRNRLEAHPWIASASVRRQWPDHLQISVVEEAPIARWRDSGFLNQSGVALKAAGNSILSDLPHLFGPKGSSREVMREYSDVSELLFVQNLKIVAFSVDEHGARTMKLASGHEVVLGRGNVIAKVQRFLTVWQEMLVKRQQEIKSIDARYDNGIAVSWEQHDVSG